MAINSKISHSVVLNIIVMLAVCVAVINCCCSSIPDLVSKEIREKCHGEPGEPRDKKNGKEKMLCSVGCSFDELGLMSGDNVDVAKLKSYASSTFTDAAKDFYLKAIDTCEPIAAKWTENMKAFMEKKGHEVKSDCKINAMPWNICLNNQRMQECPDADLSKDEKCTKLKGFVSKMAEHMEKGTE